MLPAKLNQRVLQLISEANGPITLGLLPLSANEEAECIDQVVAYCEGRLEKLIDLLRLLTPAAAAYAIAAGASQAVQEGKRFWLPVSEKLRINLADPQERKLLSDCYRATCKQLDIVNPDVSAFAWEHIAPMMAQASILHSWTGSLANGIHVTLKHRPLPDLEDPKALQRFALDLAARIHNQQNLQKILETEVGGVVVHRLISSCVYDRFEILPAHLVVPIKEALAGSGRQVSLKSPYASFSVIHGGFELVLPRQPGKLTTHVTYWLINGVQYSPISEQHLSEFEIGARNFQVKLCNLGEGYPDQNFEVNLNLDVPFRVFEEVILREREVRVGADTVLSPSEYLVVMRPDCSTNDPDSEELRGKYRLLPGVSLRPGLDSLVIYHDDVESTLSPALRAGIYYSSEAGFSTALRDGQRLHYGASFGFLAYIPKSQHAGTLTICVSNREAMLLVRKVALKSEKLSVYDYSSDLETTLQEAGSKLAAGIHPLTVKIETPATSVSRDLWYWKGLDRISQHLGFLCNEPPQNVDFGRSKGIKASANGCSSIDGYHAPRIVIALKSGEAIEIPRPGVQALCLDQADDWQTELKADETLTVGEKESRVIAFESGGFEHWSLRCNGREFATLDQNRTRMHIGLRSLRADFGKSGVIEAHSPSGGAFRLFGFAADLVAHHLELEVDHGRGLNLWRTSVPTEGIGRLGLVVRDYSESPNPVISPAVELFKEDETDGERTVVVRDGIQVSLKFLPSEGSASDQVKLCLEIEPAKMANEMLLIDFVHSSPGSDLWQSLNCVDGPNTSQLCIMHAGDGVINAEESGWWHYLWRISKSQFTDDALPLYASISEEEVESALGAISHLTAIKYPSSVYQHSAKYCSSLAHKLSERRWGNAISDDDVWWRSSARELEAHASAKVAPVVRQFLFSCNPRMRM